jgi:hypothetical protein
MVQGGANHFGRSRVEWGMTGMTARVEQLAWMTLAGGWLAAFTITAGVANFVRPYRAAWAASRGGGASGDRYRRAPSS